MHRREMLIGSSVALVGESIHGHVLESGGHNGETEHVDLQDPR